MTTRHYTHTASEWTEEEDIMLLKLHDQHHKPWKVIAQTLNKLMKDCQNRYQYLKRMRFNIQPIQYDEDSVPSQYRISNLMNPPPFEWPDDDQEFDWRLD